MANADQILSLIRNHLNNDDAQFRKVALQIYAVDAKNGHAVLARTIQILFSVCISQQESCLDVVR